MTFVPIGWADKPYGKSYSCLSHQDKEIINNGFKNLDAGKTNTEIETWINNIRINDVTNPQEAFAKNLSGIATFENNTFHFRFDYPKILQSQLKLEGNRITIADFELLTVTSQDDMIQQEEEERKIQEEISKCIEKGEDCSEYFPKPLTLAVWNNEKLLLAGNPPEGPPKMRRWYKSRFFFMRN